MAPIRTIRVIKKRCQDKIIFGVAQMTPINHDLRPEDAVWMDPGIRTFMSTYDTKGFCTE